MCLLIVQFFFNVLTFSNIMAFSPGLRTYTSIVCLAFDTVIQETSFQIRANHYSGFPLHGRTSERSWDAKLQLQSTSKFKTLFHLSKFKICD
jgi:hypothetical protein